MQTSGRWPYLLSSSLSGTLDEDEQAPILEPVLSLSGGDAFALWITMRPWMHLSIIDHRQRP